MKKGAKGNRQPEIKDDLVCDCEQCIKRVKREDNRVWLMPDKEEEEENEKQS